MREYRQKLGLTQMELAERAGLSHKYVSYLEAGQKNPGLDTTVRIAEAVGLDIDSLCGRVAAPETGNSPRLDPLQDFIRRLSPTNRTRAYATLKAAFGKSRPD